MSARCIPEFLMTTAGGTCYACHMPRHGDNLVLDTGIDIETEGTLMFCSSCVLHWNALLGGITPAHLEHINADLARMSSELTEARRMLARVAEKEARVDAEWAAVRKAGAIARGLDGEVAMAKAKANA